MKKLLTTMLSLLLLVTMSSTIVADDSETVANPESKSVMIKIKSENVYSVDITWDDLTFTYDLGTWDPETHTYIEPGWENGITSKTVTISNDSNAPVLAFVSVANDTSTNGITTTVSDEALELGEVTVGGETTKATFDVVVYGTPKNTSITEFIPSTIIVGFDSK